MQKAITKLWLSIVASLLPVVTLAQTGGMQGPGAGLSITRLGQNIANAVWVVFTIVAVIAFVVAGILFLTTGGDSEKAKNARMATLWGVAGVIIAILAFSITSLIGSAIS